MLPSDSRLSASQPISSTTSRAMHSSGNSPGSRVPAGISQIHSPTADPKLADQDKFPLRSHGYRAACAGVLDDSVSLAFDLTLDKGNDRSTE